MAASPAPVQAYTIEGYGGSLGTTGRVVAIVAGVSLLAAATVGLVYVLTRSKGAEPLPYHPPTSWATE